MASVISGCGIDQQAVLDDTNVPADEPSTSSTDAKKPASKTVLTKESPPVLSESPPPASQGGVLTPSIEVPVVETKVSPSVPTASATTALFDDIDPRESEFGGFITLTAPSQSSNVTKFTVLWADPAGVPLQTAALGSIDFATSPLRFKLPIGTALAAGASRLALRADNADQIGPVVATVAIVDFNIRSDSNLLAWLRADKNVKNESDASPADGDTVKWWNDFSAAGLRFTANPKLPHFKSDGINGHPAIRFTFDQSGGGMASALYSDSPLPAGPKTFFAVAAVDANTDYWQYIYSSRTSGIDAAGESHALVGGPGVATSDLVLSGDNADINPRFEVFPEAKVILQRPFLISQYDPLHTGADRLLHIGGALYRYIGLTGRVSEVLSFQGDLNPVSREKITSYLMEKYGI
jgi:hypothetical protein